MRNDDERCFELYRRVGVVKARSNAKTVGKHTYRNRAITKRAWHTGFSGWEQRANEYEAELEDVQLACEWAEDRAAQLDKDAKEHLAKDRESKPRGQVSPQASSRATVARLEACGAAYT
ncbi:hypothetical protein EDB85DRAFT_1898906 [Lactarius pseudohatsudake]|nr:hypothetical protein EDB85DRAFT_1898906 [Lactarius pseudohatsudake]